jgi:micrococcal nuclease
VNAELVRLGYAEVTPYPPDTEYCGFFYELEEEAIAEGRGIHGACVTTTPTPQGNCDPAYPDFCIPPPPPDLDCGDIPYKDFTVLPPDPHGFDGDHDSIGCES